MPDAHLIHVVRGRPPAQGFAWRGEGARLSWIKCRCGVDAALVLRVDLGQTGHLPQA